MTPATKTRTEPGWIGVDYAAIPAGIEARVVCACGRVACAQWTRGGWATPGITKVYSCDCGRSYDAEQFRPRQNTDLYHEAYDEESGRWTYRRGSA